MIERVDWPERELNIPFWIDMVEGFQGNFADVLHVDVFVDHDDAFCEHRLAQGPDRAHHLTRLPGVGFPNGDDHQVVKNAFDGKIDIDDLGDRELHQWQKDALDGLAHPSVFHRWFADNGGGVNGIPTVGDTRDMEDRILISQRVEAGVVAERSFCTQLVQMYVAFENYFCGRGYFQVDGFTLHQFNGFLPEKTSNNVFLDVGRSRDDGRKRQCRIGADCDRDFHLASGHAVVGQLGSAGRA